VPLEPPILDDRTFDDLKLEAQLRAARYNSAWTDFNESDPGVTLVELFAWLTEMMLYRMNQVPDLNYIKFLQLLGFERRPAQAAEAHLTFTASQQAEIDTIGKGSRVGAQPPGGGDPLIFETEDDLDVIRMPLSDIQVFDGVTFTSVTRSNQPTDRPFAPFGILAPVGSALYLGFDPPTGEGLDDPSAPRADKRVFPALMRFRVFLTTDVTAARAEVCRGGAPPAPPSSVVVAWEYRPTPTADWKALKTAGDDSNAFTRAGDILVEGPAAAAATVEGKQELGDDGNPKKHIWLRARLARGSYATGKTPEIDFIRPNTVTARNLTTVGFEQLGTSTGRPGQSFTLAHAPVFPGTLRLEIQSGGESAEWTQQDDFLGSGRDDTHYVLSAATGAVTFGDGIRGEVPPPGATIMASAYRYGGGSAGNVAAGLINQPLTNLGNLEVKNERAAEGGRDEQSLDDLKTEAPARLRCRDRAVTADDFTALAKQAGGVAHAVALPLSHPDFPDPAVKIPGVITVVIVPDTDDPNPVPTQDLIRYVCDYLDQYRLITTEIYVKKPRYQKIQVQVTVNANPSASFQQIEQAVIDAINSHLDPLGRSWVGGVPQHAPPGKPAALPTPFGQSFYPTRLFAVIQNVQNVKDVTRLDVKVDGRSRSINDPVIVPADGLVYGAEHKVVVRSA
jgi:hypothetical protein